MSNKRLIIGIRTSPPKFKKYSLKYVEDSISEINPLTAGFRVALVAVVHIDLISLLSLDICLIWKGKEDVSNIFVFKIFNSVWKF